MLYSFISISTVTDCDTAVAQADKIKRNLQFRKRSLNRQITTQSASVTGLNAELVQVESQLVSHQQALPLAATDAELRNINRNINEYENLRRSILRKLETRGPVGQLRKLFSIDYLERHIVEMEGYIAGVETRKTELSAAA